MYKALYLLIISLIIKILFYILKDFASNLEDARSYLIITPKGINNDSQEPITNYALKPEFQDLNLTYHVGQFILCNKVSGYLDMYNHYRSFFTPYVNLVIYSLYFIGWVYVIVLNILKIYTCIL